MKSTHLTLLLCLLLVVFSAQGQLKKPTSNQQVSSSTASQLTNNVKDNPEYAFSFNFHEGLTVVKKMANMDILINMER